MRSISGSLRVWLKGLVLSFLGLFVVLAHVLAQSLITTYVGPQLPVSGNPVLNQAIDVPSAVVPDGAGGLYVVSTNQNRVYEVAADGTLRLVAGSSYGFSGDGGPATDARLASPSGLALDSMGNLYIADSGNHRIREVTTDGVITTIAGTGTAGLSGDGGPATSAQLSSPTSLALDADGNLYIADTDRVRKVGVDGVISTVAGGGSASLVVVSGGIRSR
jgi:sugar lactone lactonase YvrE